jgi:hypothetical protein
MKRREFNGPAGRKVVHSPQGCGYERVTGGGPG